MGRKTIQVPVVRSLWVCESELLGTMLQASKVPDLTKVDALIEHISWMRDRHEVAEATTVRPRRR